MASNASKVTDLIPAKHAKPANSDPSAQPADSDRRGVYRVTCPRRTAVTLAADSAEQALAFYHAARATLEPDQEASAEYIGE